MTVVRKLAAGLAVLATAVIAGVGIAQADGTPAPKAAAVTAPTSWSGLYFGAHAGWQWSDTDIRFAAPPNSTLSIDHDSPVAGGQIGIQHQFGNLVVGIEGALTAAYQNNPGSVLCPGGGALCKSVSRFEDVLTIGPRLGWAMGKWMPYITGGYASARFIERGTTAGVTFDQASERHSGWYIGGGVDMALAQGWMVGLEYRHYEFDTSFYALSTPAGLPVPGDNLTLEPTSDIVTLRVSWKLGRPEPVAKPMK